METLDYRTLPAVKPLFLDYLERFDAVESFFAGNPYDQGSWAATAARVQSVDRPREETAAALVALNGTLGADESALGSLERLRDGALVVITGQQVGLFGGPLYTLYKAVSAVQLARAMESQLGTPVVPLFWMDTDDHDFDEVQSVALIDASRALTRVRYEDDGDANRSVGGHVLSDAITDVVDRISDALPPTEFKDEIVAVMRECYAPGRTMAEAFGSWILRLTRGTGLAVVDPSLPELKAQAASLFERELGHPDASAEQVRNASEKLIAHGYHAQATPAESGVNLFLADPERRAVKIADADDATKLVALAKSEPSRFSPNVLLRPIYQDTLFPTIAYVAGPSELAYFAQLKGVYEMFDVPMPLIVPRMSFTVVERKEARFIDRYDVDVTKLASDNESVLNEIVRQQTPPELEEDLSRARTCIEDITVALERDVQAVDASLVPTVKSTRGKLLHHLKELETKTQRAIKRNNDTVRQQFLSTRTALFPEFVMQERKLGALGYLSKYGWFFSEMVAQGSDMTRKSHALLRP